MCERWSLEQERGCREGGGKEAKLTGRRITGSNRTLTRVRTASWSHPSASPALHWLRAPQGT